MGRRSAGGRLVADRADAKAVKLIMGRHEDGSSLRQIVAELERAGIPSKRGGSWHPTTVARVIARDAVPSSVSVTTSSIAIGVAKATLVSEPFRTVVLDVAVLPRGSVATTVTSIAPSPRLPKPASGPLRTQAPVSSVATRSVTGGFATSSSVTRSVDIVAATYDDLPGPASACNVVVTPPTTSSSGTQNRHIIHTVVMALSTTEAAA